MMQKSLMLFCLALFSASAFSSVTVTLYSTEDVAKNAKPKSIGQIVFQDSLYGLEIKPNLTGLTPGFHGLHLHENPSCGKNATDAGGHFDPARTGQHSGPYTARGHLGDLPVLYVNKEGIANKTVFAPRLHEKDLYGHALIIHGGGDNYSDHPQPLGGGGGRIACGVIEAQ